jgi:tryptophan synthase alpha chain
MAPGERVGGMVAAVTDRIKATFERLRSSGRRALIPYITAGDPDLTTTGHLLDALVAGGADVVELGVPFSDPMADGPVIQRAMERALEKGTSLRDVLACARSFRERHPDTPLVLFGYLNPIHALGFEAFVEAVVDAGIDGVLVVDLPVEESAVLTEPLARVGVHFIRLFTPTTTAARLEDLQRDASGFAYCVSVAGVTGGAVMASEVLGERVTAIQAATGLPVAVGFGIRTPEDAATMADLADGVVVGSALVAEIEARAAVEAPARILEVLTRFRAAIDGAEVIPLTSGGGPG